MTFEQLAAAVGDILVAEGYQLLAGEGWCWDGVLARVRFSNPSQASPMMPHIVGVQRYEASVERGRYLSPQTQAIPTGPADAGHIAELIRQQLGKPV